MSLPEELRPAEGARSGLSIHDHGILSLPPFRQAPSTKRGTLAVAVQSIMGEQWMLQAHAH
jgi:hypothetical protein